MMDSDVNTVSGGVRTVEGGTQWEEIVFGWGVLGTLACPGPSCDCPACYAVNWSRIPSP